MNNSKKQIDAILQFLPSFEADGFKFGEWDSREGAFPFYVLSDEARKFMQALYNSGWVEPFDWTEWQDEAERFVNEPEAVAAADLDDLRRLLTTHVRKERFCEGHLACMLECGNLTAILRRLKKIRGEMK